MPRRKKTWSKRATTTGIVLGLVASIPMNLLTLWLQKYVLVNIIYFGLVIFLVGALIYFARNKHVPELLTTVFWLLVATVSLNLFSTWVQDNILHDSFTFKSVTAILSLCVIVLAASAIFQSHYYRRFAQSVNARRRWNAKSMSYASRGRKTTVKKVTKRIPPTKRKKI